MKTHVRLTVNLSKKSSDALDQLSELNVMNKTTVVNQALQVLAYIQKVSDAGGELLIRETADGDLMRTTFSV